MAIDYCWIKSRNFHVLHVRIYCGSGGTLENTCLGRISWVLLCLPWTISKVGYPECEKKSIQSCILLKTRSEGWWGLVQDGIWLLLDKILKFPCPACENIWWFRRNPWKHIFMLQDGFHEFYRVCRWLIPKLVALNVKRKVFKAASF